MPKFKTIEITRANKTGEKRREKFDIHVDAYGQFYTAAPEDVFNAAASIARLHGATVQRSQRKQLEGCRLLLWFSRCNKHIRNSTEIQKRLH